MNNRIEERYCFALSHSVTEGKRESFILDGKSDVRIRVFRAHTNVVPGSVLVKALRVQGKTVLSGIDMAFVNGYPITAMCPTFIIGPNAGVTLECEYLGIPAYNTGERWGWWKPWRRPRYMICFSLIGVIDDDFLT
jgi:hypothetical protein